MPKKEPYTDDPNATLTICYKKRRRHLPSDLLYVPIKTESVERHIPGKVGEEAVEAAVPVPQVTVKIICKHCDANPVVDPTTALA